ncbi:hypothetical protein D3C85_1296470 [compost metagenome]
MRGQDLAPQRMALHRLGMAHAQRLGEVVGQQRGDEGVLGQVRDQQFVVQPHLAIGQQHRAFGRGQPRAECLAFGDLVLGGQEFERTVEPARALQPADQPRFGVEQLRRLTARHGERLGLVVVVLQHQQAHLVGHLGQQRVALLDGHLAIGHHYA